MKPGACTALAALIVSLVHCPAWADSQPNPMPMTPTVVDERVLNKQTLDRVKRHILASGKRCTYSNKYNHNPFLELPDFWLYLNPDPWTKDQPQMNVDSDPSKGDFNELVVREKADNSVYHSVVFRDANDIRLGVHDDASRRAMERAVLEVLQLIDARSSGQQGAPRTPSAQRATTHPHGLCLR